MKYYGGIDQERLRFATNDLIYAYVEVKKTLRSYDDLWMIYYLLEEKPEVLIESGWTQNQIDSAGPIKKKISNAYKELKKITKKYIDINLVEMMLVRMNVDTFDMLAAGPPTAAFIFQNLLLQSPFLLISSLLQLPSR